MLAANSVNTLKAATSHVLGRCLRGPCGVEKGPNIPEVGPERSGPQVG